jgi:glucokinase
MDGGRMCSCGREGHLEAYASATAMVKRAREVLARDDTPSTLRQVPLEAVSSRLIADAAAAGDALAAGLMGDTARYLAVGAVSMMHTIDPDLILFAGGMTNAGAPLLDEIRRNVLKMAFPIPAAKTRIEFAKLGDEAGLVGAAGWARKILTHPS